MSGAPVTFSKKILFFINALLCCLLMGCDSAVDQRENLPSIFQIKERVYNKAVLSKLCSVNVYSLNDEFKEKFAFEMLEKINAEKLPMRLHQVDQSYEPWQKTPVYQNIHHNSKAVGTLSVAKYCFEDSPQYWDLFKKYSAGENAYFTIYSGEIVMYVPEENLIFYTNWD